MRHTRRLYGCYLVTRLCSLSPRLGQKAYASTLKMGAPCSSETFVNFYQNTRCHIQLPFGHSLWNHATKEVLIFTLEWEEHSFILRQTEVGWKRSSVRLRNGSIVLSRRDVGWGGVDWIDLAQNRDWSRALTNTVMNPRVP
jgi:hypothetical protein